LNESLMLEASAGGEHSTGSSPMSVGLASPLDISLSDSESVCSSLGALEKHEHHHHHRHHHEHEHRHHHFRSRRMTMASDSSSEYSDASGTVTIISEGDMPNPATAGKGSLYSNPTAASPMSLLDFSPSSTCSVSILHKGVEPALEFEKVCLVGGNSVGKTSLVDCIEHSFSYGAQKPTQGFSVRAFSCLANDSTRFDVQVYDINGSERRPVLLKPFFADCGAVVLCYAVNSRASLRLMQEWIALMKLTLPSDAKMPPLFILGCKGDCSREVQLEDVSMLTINTGASFLGECSCTKPQLVEEAFSRVALSLFLTAQFNRFKKEVLK